MGYLINQSGLQFSGIITAAQINSLGSTPFVFDTPSGFYPLTFGLTEISGSTQAIFSDILILHCPSNGRIYLQHQQTTPTFPLYNFFGMTAGFVNPNVYNEQLNVEPFIGNNLALAPGDFIDPTPGDVEYKYNLYGFILV